MLQTLEGLHHRNQKVLAEIRAQIVEIIAMERDLPLDLPNPSLCATAVCTVDLHAADATACDQILDTVTSAAIAGTRQWNFDSLLGRQVLQGVQLIRTRVHAGSTPEMALDHRRATTMVCFRAVHTCLWNTVCTRGKQLF